VVAMWWQCCHLLSRWCLAQLIWPWRWRGDYVPPKCQLTFNGLYSISRSQWLRGLRHKLSSLARTLGSWVRIPLKAWMFFCVYFVFVLSCVGSGLAMDWSPVQGVLESYCLRIKKLKRNKKSFLDALCFKVGASRERERERERERDSIISKK
jgi:hypothetical protein